ncbi:hypothetical protein A3A74_06390 [Candidatus Roizmanbacteria bacterium RIFCSPLOWO2_01_FULL_35_13]|uniref:Uncharacterized protein n=1 Tax=Candidatus Roizmanbacteria bacterium RIFCSPLOWO2_01_FULL_35_13 TaxID=1802055 RepID=A0A1F7IH42_9BACT|nr:MAG: hypothetical protein A3A74_06390 [Candidatus Roizmanbacteria bacterium RIFCSPLOWO2_01_FULL_35_13]
MDVYALDLSDKNINPLAKIATIGQLMNVFLPALIIGAAILLLIMLLYGSYTWITAGGNAENVAKAQKIMTYSVFGLVLVILSLLFVRLITTIFKISAPL